MHSMAQQGAKCTPQVEMSVQAKENLLIFVKLRAFPKPFSILFPFPSRQMLLPHRWTPKKVYRSEWTLPKSEIGPSEYWLREEPANGFHSHDVVRFGVGG